MEIRKILSIIFPCVIAVLFGSCGDDDRYPVEDWEGRSEGQNYSWALDDNGLLHCTNKSLDEQTFLTEVCGYVWVEVAKRSLDIDLNWETEMHRPSWWTGGRSGHHFFTHDKFITFNRIFIESEHLTDAEWIYEERPITWENGRCVIDGYPYNLVGMLSGLYLEGIYSHRLIDGTPTSYSYEIYERCDDIDIAEVMKSAITGEELDSLYYEWALSQRENGL